jgi:hypothetical protein
MEGQKENYFQFQFLEGARSVVQLSADPDKNWRSTIGILETHQLESCLYLFATPAMKRNLIFGYLFMLDSPVEETYNPMLA